MPHRRAAPYRAAQTVHFFLPLPFALVVDPFETTLLAREVDAEAGEALPLTASSCLFCNTLAFNPYVDRVLS
jgi:hypothetical protein